MPANKVSPEEVRAAREAAGLTQTEAAAVLGKAKRTWQNWEAPKTSSEHRGMDPALLELFHTKLAGINASKKVSLELPILFWKRGRK